MKNKRGDVIVISMIIVAIVALISIGIASIVTFLNKQTRVTRVKALMHEQELAILSLLLNPASYPEDLAHPGTYVLVDTGTLFNSVNQIRHKSILGAECPTATPHCGIDLLAGDSLDPATNIYTGTLKYTGIDVPLKEYQVQLQVPPPNLIDTGAVCKDTAPLFAGVDSAGKPVCRAIQYCSGATCLPAACPASSVAVGFDLHTRNIICKPLTPVTCDSVNTPLLYQQKKSDPTYPSYAKLKCNALYDPYLVWGEIK